MDKSFEMLPYGVTIFVNELQKEKGFVFKKDAVEYFKKEYRPRILDLINKLIDLGIIDGSFEKRDKLFEESITVSPVTFGFIEGCKQDGIYDEALKMMKELRNGL